MENGTPENRRQRRRSRVSDVLFALVTVALLLTALEMSWSDTLVGADAARHVKSAGGVFERIMESFNDEDVAGGGEETVTILVYMNGSDLETELGSATADLSEMVRAGSSSQVNILVQTMGTLSWEPKYGIASDRSQVWEVTGSGLELVRDDMDQLDCTRAETLEDFVSWGAAAYPADRYMLLMWDHGGGPVYGFGYDELHPDPYAALTLDEIDLALENAGVHFDLIGFDACIMASIEVYTVLADHCDYSVLSEDFEPSAGWFYTDWVKALYEDTSIGTAELGTLIADSTVAACGRNRGWGGEIIVTVFDESKAEALFDAWTDFAYANTDALTSTDYSLELVTQGRVMPAIADRSKPLAWNNELGIEAEAHDEGIYGEEEEEATLADYFVVDILAVAAAIPSDESGALAAALDEAVVHTNATEGDKAMCGLSVALPYGDRQFYREQRAVYAKCGIDPEYLAWLGAFAEPSAGSGDFDFTGWGESWGGWNAFGQWEGHATQGQGIFGLFRP